MEKVQNLGAMIVGKPDKAAAAARDAATQAQARQQSQIDARAAELDAMEAGQRRVRSGGRGLFSFLDEAGLVTTLGGFGAAGKRNLGGIT